MIIFNNLIRIFSLVEVTTATSLSGVLEGLRVYIYNVLYYYAVIIIMYQ